VLPAPGAAEPSRKMVGLPCVPQQNHVALLAACWPSQKALLNTAPTFNPDSNALGKLTYVRNRADRSR